MRIGVFDSGFGGLTVLRALRSVIPHAEYLYLGDTARLPYGSKSQATIARYAVSSSQFLLDQGCEFLVIACNTASALALEEIRRTADRAGVPVEGVISPGAMAAATGSTTRDTLILATSATVQSHAYAAACESYGLRSIEKACPLLVPLVEEGWIDHSVTAEVVAIYLGELHAQARAAELSPDSLILGCTHYPLLREVLAKAIVHLWPENPPQIIDSARATAHATEKRLRSAYPRKASVGETTLGGCRFFATDSVEKFQQLGSRFLGEPISEVELVDLEG